MSDTRKEIENLIVNDKVEKAFERLLGEFPDWDEHDTILLLSSQWNAATRQENMGIVPRSELNFTYNRIKSSLFSLLKNLPEKKNSITDQANTIDLVDRVKESFIGQPSLKERIEKSMSEKPSLSEEIANSIDEKTNAQQANQKEEKSALPTKAEIEAWKAEIKKPKDGKIRVFVCYASQDIELFKDFILRFADINYDYEILYDATPHSGHIHKRFVEFAMICDVALILCSPRFVKPTSYANQIEVPILKERFDAGVVKIVPIHFMEVPASNIEKWNKELDFYFFQLKFGEIHGHFYKGMEQQAAVYQRLAATDKSTYHTRLYEWIEELLKTEKKPAKPVEIIAATNPQDEESFEDKYTYFPPPTPGKVWVVLKLSEIQKPYWIDIKISWGSFKKRKTIPTSTMDPHVYQVFSLNHSKNDSVLLKIELNGAKIVSVSQGDMPNFSDMNVFSL